MSLPDSVQNYLDDQQISYRLLPFPAGETLIQIAERLSLPTRRIVRAVLLQDVSGLIMTLLPCSHILDFSVLCQLLQRDIEPLYGAETARFFQKYGCKIGSYPPLPTAFGLSALADSSLATLPGDEEIY